MTTTIIGAGGGKNDQGSDRTPITERDSLDSREFANMTEVIAEGPIEGLANGLKSIFLNDTALQNADGTYNFQDVDVYTRTGTATQTPIPLDSSLSVLTANAVGVPVTKDFPVVRTISDTSVDAIRPVITIPALQRINNENGDTLGTEVRLKISVKYTNISTGAETAYEEVIDDEIRGRTADPYNRQYEIRFRKGAGEVGENSTYTVKITRVTDDSNDQLLSNSLNWTSYTTVKFTSQAYPNSALIALRLDAQQFSSIPSRKYDIKGLKVQIPTGVTVDSDSGRIIYPTNFIWDGTFQAATWTACPSWLLYALMLNTRFGLGDHFDSTQLDKWAFFRASKYANEEVEYTLDGVTTKEARFSCNATINSTDEAYKVINQLLSVMRSQGFWEDGSLTIAQDGPSDPVYNFSQSNVTEQGFSYTNASNKNKPTVVVVAYLDLVLKDKAYEVVKDMAAIAKRGVVKKSITAFACTSRAQANRLGKWFLYEENNSEVVGFTSNLVTAQLLRPGQIISIADPVKAGYRRAGRISSATINSIVIDDKGDISDIPTDNTPTLSVVLSDGTFDKDHAIASVDYVYCVTDYWVTGYTSDSGTITIEDSFQSVPEANSIWVVESTDLQTSLWRVLGVKEEEDFLYTVKAISHNESKYAHIEQGIALTERDTTNLNVIPAAPTNVQILDVPRYDGTTTKELQYELNGKIAIKITFHWGGVSGSDRYRVKWRHEDDNYTTQIVNGTTLDLVDVKTGIYSVQVSSINSTGLLFSAPATGEYDVRGLQGNPDDITGLSMVPISETLAVLSWREVVQLDVKLGGRIIIRHDPRTSGASWLTSNKIVDGVSGASTQKQVPLLAGTYFVKAQDYLGNKSTTPASFTTTLPETTRRFNVKTWSEETAFSGGKVNSGLAVSGNNLVLTPNPYVSSGYHDPFYVDGDEEGEYTFATTFDFAHSGVQYDAVLRKEVVSNSIAATGTAWDSRSGQFDDASGTMDGDVIDEANVDLYVRTTPDNPSSSPTWGNWAEFEAAIIRARGVQVKAVITSTNTDAKVTISDLGATLDLLQRTDSASVAANASASTGVYNVTFEKAFYDTPQVQITPNASSTTLHVSISSLSRTGFTATFNNGSNVDTAFMYTVTGFGRAI